MWIRTFAWLAARKSYLLAAGSVVVAALAWASFCILLAARGHAPSVTLLPIAPDAYYAWQALLLTPVLCLQWLTTAALGHRLGGTRSFAATAKVIGPALAAPLLALFVLPDFVAYGLAGFAALGPLVRVSGPLTLATAVAAATVALRAAGAPSGGRAFAAAAFSVVLPAALAGLILR